MLLSAAANQTIIDNAPGMATALFEATVKGNATAASLLVRLAEGAESMEDPAVFQRVLTMAEKWALEAQVPLQLTAPGETLCLPEPQQLTDGKNSPPAPAGS
ncbi:MAG TPA: hypothetical protein VG225_13310 [Terracidiphilus sp.]|nr:hypothetical protein [Terracidiphilus sp.]